MVTLRPATPADVPVLEYWDTQPHVIAATGDDQIDWPSEIAALDPHQETLMAELDGRPIGVVQVIDPALERTHYWGNVEQHLRAIDIWIGEAADLGQGYGTQMMTLVLDRCFAPPEVTAVLIDPLTSNTRAHRFYQRLGFIPVGERSFGEDRCLVHRLDRTAWIKRRDAA
jgi:aminoglycoside 6'-N-acetyltransferase